jgi:hypothetical protein
MDTTKIQNTGQKTAAVFQSFPNGIKTNGSFKTI